MKKELDNLTEKLLSEMNGKKNAISASFDCPFSCKNVKGNLLKHFDEEHNKDLAFACTGCGESITRGLKQFVIHQISYHPQKSASHLLGNVNHNFSEILRPKKCRKTDFKAICPYCKVPVHFTTENSLRSHLESLHEDALESEVLGLMGSVRFTAADRSAKEVPIASVDEEKSDLESESCDESSAIEEKIRRSKKRKKIKSKIRFCDVWGRWG